MFKSLALGSLTIIVLFNRLLGFAEMRSAQIKAEYPAPGRMIDIGGYQLQIYCLGQESPTVIMEAGLGNPGLSWTLVQPEIAMHTRVCVYDRAGLGWSDPSPRGRTADVMVDELHTLLKNANIETPYVLVGHSFGGLLMRLYAHKYPEEIVGMVLVDSYHYTQMEEYPKVNGKGNPWLNLALQVLELWIVSGIPAMDPSLLPAMDLNKLPSNALESYQALAAAGPKSTREAQAELASLQESGEQEKSANISSLGAIPLIVLSHGYLEPRLLDPIGKENYGDYEIFWRSDQAKLALLSTHGHLVIAPKSGHYIQLDQPDLVIGAIEQVLAEIPSYGLSNNKFGFERICR